MMRKINSQQFSIAITAVASMLSTSCGASDLDGQNVTVLNIDAEVQEYIGQSEQALHRRPLEPICFTSSFGGLSEVDVSLPRRLARRVLRRTPSYAGPCYHYGDETDLSDGNIRTYFQEADGVPLAIGANFTASMLQGLPASPNDEERCFDVNEDGIIPPHGECIGGHDFVLDLPSEVDTLTDSPFDWKLLNWNTFGHDPSGTYDFPYFDFHFYTLDLETRSTIDVGPCGLLIDCDDFETATLPIPSQYMPQDCQYLGVAEAAMGNHLIDLTSHEWTDPGSFDHSFIYGGWDTEIAFYEPMITRQYLLSEPKQCTPVEFAPSLRSRRLLPTGVLHSLSC